MKEDAAEQEFWKESLIHTKTYAPEASSRQVLAFLRPLFAAHQIETALEIGPGWGNYTLDLAAICTEVACVTSHKMFCILFWRPVPPMDTTT